ncbi:MAG: peptidylprolyl isomerase [Gammaproteobacteria bacterium]|nr:peptidylprolyl isomerase [Gammaproteobacteria bacterium]
MKTADDMVVTLNYTLTDDSGTVLDSSADGMPLSYLHGHGNIIPGLERALEGTDVGYKSQVTVPAVEGYGEKDPKAVFEAPRDQFPPDMDIAPGMLVTSEDGKAPLTIVEITDSVVVLDGNHPLAGKTLHFDVEIVDIRAATEAELTHGHAHSGDGHHHH